MQPTLSNADGLGKRKQTRREIFLEEMERVVPWKKLIPLIEPHYPVSGWQGLQRYPVSAMLRIPLLQQWYALSNPAFKQLLHEISPLRRFAQLGGLDDIPDETAILTLVACWRPTALPRGFWIRSTPIWCAKVQAFGLAQSSVRLSSQHPAHSNVPIPRNPETYQNKKSNRWYFGTKVRIGIDEFGAVSASAIHRSHVADVKVTQENAKNSRPGRPQQTRARSGRQRRC